MVAGEITYRKLCFLTFLEPELSKKTTHNFWKKREVFHFFNSYAIGRSILGVFHGFWTHILNAEQYYTSFTLSSLVHGESLLVVRVKQLLFVFWCCLQGFSPSVSDCQAPGVRCCVCTLNSTIWQLKIDIGSVCTYCAFSKASNVFSCLVRLSDWQRLFTRV